MSERQQFWCRSAPWRAFSARLLLPWALQGQALHGDVLEIGSGSGAMASGILRRHPEIHLTGTDYDQAMVEAARTRLGGYGDRVAVRRADATALPFADDTFDNVVTFVMLHHVVAWEAALSEVARVLRPGGALIGYDLIGDGVGRFADRREHGIRLMRVAELRHQLERHPYVDAHIKRSVAALTVRFRARRAA